MNDYELGQDIFTGTEFGGLEGFGEYGEFSGFCKLGQYGGNFFGDGGGIGDGSF